MRPGIFTARSSTAEIRLAPPHEAASRTFAGTFAGKRGSIGTSDVTQLQAGRQARPQSGGYAMNSIIYLVGLVVVVLAILSFLGLR